MKLGCGCSVRISPGPGLFAGPQHLVGVWLSRRSEDPQVELGLRLKTGACVGKGLEGASSPERRKENTSSWGRWTLFFKSGTGSRYTIMIAKFIEHLLCDLEQVS